MSTSVVVSRDPVKMIEQSSVRIVNDILNTLDRAFHFKLYVVYGCLYYLQSSSFQIRRLFFAQTAAQPAMKDQCELVGPVSIFFQFLLGFIILASLVLKRQYEVPKRPMRTWLLDISKQVIGSLIIHFMNLAMSIEYKNLFDDGDPMVDYECNWYFINLFMDSTVGVLILYFFLVLLYRLIPHTSKEETLLPQTNAQHSSSYPIAHEEPFGKSLSIFLTALISMKFVIYLFLLSFTTIIIKISDFLNLIGDSNLKVFIVIFLSPIFLNLLQFLITDNIIKLMRLRY